ncbi:TetR/AcrR family transcriptional repressor of multidrug resistance operon [Aeromicrobium panaciterrae]|uniref:TetR/AcrR family transcriptional repressor of multidrug resistance operon n=1 Tax=Aeromicrobium panaciterrae TaxID=363861 RepID=A0ABU1UMQ9_9ACTN|nr:TetR/AcrR family transcriptional regulator [Aeromicrobium panaciterrae]MDR7086475.1 TetR/AcrR family transcriptional repressor of multidrug resistance operon [Aeromicrobium panaciterrae]
MTSPVAVDRAEAVRHALIRLVARDGFHGTSMAAIAKEAGVATGTAYVHYASKDELVLATYLEVKQGLGEAALASVDAKATSRDQFAQLWTGVQHHLEADPDRARFLVQADSSPYAEIAHEKAIAALDDPLMSSPVVAALLEQMVDLPPEVLFDLAVGPVVRLTASQRSVDESLVDPLIEACWRAVTTP